MTFLEWWLIALSAVMVFHLYATVAGRKGVRRRDRMLLEIHGMLEILTERDPQFRVDLMRAAVREHLHDD